MRPACFSFWLAMALAGTFAFSSFAQTPLVNHGDTWRYRKGTSAPQADWKTVADAGLDGTWLTGRGGFGYADNVTETQLVQTVLGDMRSNYWTVEMRSSFVISSAVDTNLHLQLTMDYDDGFIAWLDGAYLTSGNSPGAPNEPAFNAAAPANHESFHGNPPGPAPTVADLGAVGSRLGIGTHVLAIIGLNNTLASSDLIQIADLALVTNSGPACTSGLISANTTWYRTNSPILACGSVTISSGVTLTIEAGVTVQMPAGAGITIANGGRLVADGTAANRIRFTRAGTNGNWGNILVNGAAGSPETRISYASFDLNANDTGIPCIDVQAGTVFLDHLIFGNTGAPYIHVDSASFMISDCFFPTPSAGFEPCHGQHGLKSGGRGIFLRNFFGKPQGYNDVVDFTGSHRRSLPIVQFIDNVFMGGDDDGVDIDGTDAWVEGNIFLHFHKNGATPDSSSAVSGGNNPYSPGDPGGSGTETSQITVIRNIMYDCDQAADAKQGNFYTFFNNTIVHQTHVGGVDTDGALIILADAGTTEGRGIYLEGNIAFDAEKLTRNVTAAIITFSNNILPFAWSGPGGGNSVTNPLFKHVPLMSETVFTNWAQAQIMRDWLSLQTNSPAIATGPYGQDKGAVIPAGASISGEPIGTTSQTNTTLIVGINRTGNGIPTAGFPLGSGYTHYKWRLDGTNVWSAETPISSPLSLQGLRNGPHSVDVVGKNDAGWYQDDPALGIDAHVTTSPTWHVQNVLRITSANRGGSTVTLHFVAAAGNTYTLEGKNSLSDPNWVNLVNVPAQTTTGDYPVTDVSATGPYEFYQIVSPAQ